MHCGIAPKCSSQSWFKGSASILSASSMLRRLHACKSGRLNDGYDLNQLDIFVPKIYPVLLRWVFTKVRQIFCKITCCGCMEYFFFHFLIIFFFPQIICSWMISTPVDDPCKSGIMKRKQFTPASFIMLELCATHNMENYFTFFLVYHSQKTFFECQMF